MTQDKDLLLKDLSARLPYGVICQYKNENRPLFCVRPTQYYKIALDNAINVKHNGVENCVIEEVKPYLFPLSSMTKEQWRELFEIAGYEVRGEDCGRHTEMYYYDMVGHENTLYPNCDAIDWLNAHHFDYRHLISKGLAIDATGLNIY